MTDTEKRIINHEINACGGYYRQSLSNCRERFQQRKIQFTDEHETYILDTFPDE